MNPIIQLKQQTPVFMVAVVLACLAIPRSTQAVVPAPDGGYPNANTAEGDTALLSLTTGADNTAVGLAALASNLVGSDNTAVGTAALLNNAASNNTALGSVALFNNISGTRNTASGFGALFSNTTISGNSGNDNTAVGFVTLASNTTGSFNTATGSQALANNTTGRSNSANGYQSLFHNNIGFENTASGDGALFSNTAGDSNTAVGYQALLSNSAGFANTAIGDRALFINTGSDNIALGVDAGASLTTGSHNIAIGSSGVAAESGTIRIGNGIHTSRAFIAGIVGVNEGNFPTAVFINTTTGQLGTTPPASSRRFKKEIKAMDKISEAILAFNPVTFHYKSDTKDTPQFGLIAEEVAAVNPDLVVRDEKGEIYSVRYDAVNAMLLNEFLKARRQIDAQQKQIEALTAGLQKVSAQVEMSRTAPQMVVDNQ
jgi:hypothetical protein